MCQADPAGITIFDVAVIAVAFFGALIGMSAGFAHAILFIGSWIGAGWAAWRFSKVVEPEVQQIVGSTELAYFISMLAVFVAALIVWAIAARLIRLVIHATPLSIVDRGLGAVFGLLRGVVLLLADRLRRWLGASMVSAIEKLMGLVLTAVAVEMILAGLKRYFFS